MPNSQAGLVYDGARIRNGASDIEWPVTDNLDRNDRLFDKLARDEDLLDPLAHGVEIEA